MVIDMLDEADRYAALHPLFAAAFQYLRVTDFTRMAEGRHPLIDDRLVAIVNRYQTKLPREAVWESHRRYLDIQYVVSGQERMGYVPLTRAPAIKTPYSDERDIIFYEPGEETFTLSAGQFTIFYPQDIHAPGLALEEPADVLKIVMKVACNS